MKRLFILIVALAIALPIAAQEATTALTLGAETNEAQTQEVATPTATREIVEPTPDAAVIVNVEAPEPAPEDTSGEETAVATLLTTQNIVLGALAVVAVVVVVFGAAVGAAAVAFIRRQPKPIQAAIDSGIRTGLAELHEYVEMTPDELDDQLYAKVEDFVLDILLKAKTEAQAVTDAQVAADAVDPAPSTLPAQEPTV